MNKHIHEDKLLAKLGQWKSEDSDRASEVGEQRSDIKSFLETTGWHKGALATIRRLDKMSQEKRDDFFRSFDDMRAVLELSWDGQKTPDMFPEDEAVEIDVPTDGNKPSYEPDPEFEAHLAKVAAE